MSKFKPGVRVAVIDSDTHEIRKGVIDNVYETLEVAIVKFDDGNVEKVGFDYLSIESETKIQEEKPTESEEKSEITITPEEFMEISCSVIAKETKDMPVVGFVCAGIMSKIHKALFDDER